MIVSIFYEGIERELQNAYLLKAELEKRGHNVYIYHLFDLIWNKLKLNYKPDIVFMPYMYEDHQLDYVKEVFEHKLDRIINLQYEQIITKRGHDVGIAIPKRLCRNVMHLCWGEKWKNIMISGNVPKENVKVVGSLNIDMDLERFDSIYRNKEEMAKEYNLDKNKKWVLFLSSFAMVNLTEFRLKYNTDRFGEEAKIRADIDTETRDIVLKWFEKYAKENDCEFIYRPHPGEALDTYISDIEKNNSNFHIIKRDSVRSWLKVSDKINTWASTSIVDVYFMKKNCSIIRPIDLPEFMHNGMTDEGDFIRNYEEFEYFNNNEITKFPINPELILENFTVDENKYAYEKIADIAEDLYNRGVVMKLYNDMESNGEENVE